MYLKSSLWNGFLLLALILTLTLPILPACGSKEETAQETPTPVLTVTIAPAATSIASPTATSSPSTAGPVKIGAITAWSGPAATSGSLADPIIKLVEWQVKQMGGILGGRDIEVVKYDSRGTVAEAAAGATKLLKENNVSALVFGGVSGADNNAISDFAEANQILFVPFGSIPNVAETKYTVSGTYHYNAEKVRVVDFTTNVLKPKTIGLLGVDLADSHLSLNNWKEGIEATGVKVVYEQYTPVDTIDYTPYLTKIKYSKPDVLLTYYAANDTYLAIAKQITELGGWDNIKVIGVSSGEAAVKLPGAQGWYLCVGWFPGLPYPGAVKFEQDFKAMYGRLPMSVQVYFYNPLWTAIYAIKLAGTDTDRIAIAQAARSGNLEWDTPMGPAHFSTTGDSGLYPTFVQIEGQKEVLVQFP